MKRVFFIMLICALMLGIAACTRSKSATQEVDSKSAEVPEEEAAVEGDVMKELELFVTQTAIAAEGGQVEAGETEPEVVEAEPVEGQPAEGESAEATPLPAEDVVVEATPVPTEEAVDEPAVVEPTEVVVVVPEPTAGIPTTHTIEKGESIYCISRRYNVNPTEVLSVNGISSAEASALRVGTVLKIPQTGNPFPGVRALNAHPDTYTVDSGDSIYAVACYYGDVDPMVIAQVNGIAAPYELVVGQQLQIP